MFSSHLLFVISYITCFAFNRYGIRPAGMPSGPQGMRVGFQPPMGGRGGISRGRGLLGIFAP